jgi:hypothetical protein
MKNQSSLKKNCQNAVNLGYFAQQKGEGFWEIQKKVQILNAKSPFLNCLLLLTNIFERCRY